MTSTAAPWMVRFSTLCSSPRKVARGGNSRKERLVRARVAAFAAPSQGSSAPPPLIAAGEVFLCAASFPAAAQAPFPAVPEMIQSTACKLQRSESPAPLVGSSAPWGILDLFYFSLLS